MLNCGKKFRAQCDKKQQSNSCVVRKDFSERNKKTYPSPPLQVKWSVPQALWYYCSQTLLNYLVFQSSDFYRTRRKFFQKRVVSQISFLRFQGYRVMVFNATFNSNSAISWRLILLVEETGVSPFFIYALQLKHINASKIKKCVGHKNKGGKDLLPHKF